jgi:hypothetical protein
LNGGSTLSASKVRRGDLKRGYQVFGSFFVLFWLKFPISAQDESARRSGSSAVCGG